MAEKRPHEGMAKRRPVAPRAFARKGGGYAGRLGRSAGAGAAAPPPSDPKDRRKLQP